LALISSMAIVRPRVIASPASADWPDSAVTRPILIGSAAKAACVSPTPMSAIAAEMKERRIIGSLHE
jgi:hypothetical protein